MFLIFCLFVYIYKYKQPKQSRITQNVSQQNTTSASFINTQSFISVLDNHQLKIVNVQIAIEWDQIRITSLQECTQVPITYIRESHLAQTFRGSHLVNAFAEQLILNVWKGPRCQRHCQISDKGPLKRGIRL